MVQLTCTRESLDLNKIDEQPFKFTHTLTDHPALQLDNLGKVLPRLPKGHVFYSAGLKHTDNFDRAHIEKSNGLSIEETLERIRTSNAYIMVRAPEQDESFRGLFNDLVADMNKLTVARGLGQCTNGSMLYLFIASPNSITPFHFDRYSTVLFQFRGQKTIWVAPPWDERVISTPDTEAFAARAGSRPMWKPELESLGTQFHFSPGEALHIPFVSGHYVQNGADDVSISMSIIFNTRDTGRQLNALEFNHMMRSSGWSPSKVGRSKMRDSLKSSMCRVVRLTKRRANRD